MAVLFFSLYTADGEIIISNITYTQPIKYLVIGLLALLLFLNLYSIYTKRRYQIAHLASGIFILIVGFIHAHRIFDYTKFSFFGSCLSQDVSTWAASILLPIAALNIYTSFYAGHNNVHNADQKGLRLIQRIAFLRIKLNHRRVSPYTATILGLGAAFFVAIPFLAISFFLVEFILSDLFDEGNKLQEIAWIGMVGAQGSIVSILLRMRKMKEYIVRKSVEPNFDLFLNALFRPYIGLSLAHLSYFMFESEFIKLSEQSLILDIETHVVIAFLTGFTERIGGDYLARSQKDLESIYRP